METLHVIHSHTCSESRRVVPGDLPGAVGGPLLRRHEQPRREFGSWRADDVRDPRGPNALVAAPPNAMVESGCPTNFTLLNKAGPSAMRSRSMVGVTRTPAQPG